MSPSRWCLIALTALTPISVQVHTHGDTIATVTRSDGTRFEVMAGTGEYAFITRGCEGQVLNERPVSFREVGGAIEHGFGSSGLTVGVRGGWMHDDFSSGVDQYTPPTPYPRVVIENHYVNPYLTAEGEQGSVGFGWVWADRAFVTTSSSALANHPTNTVSGHLRLGSDRRYAAARLMEGVPLYSSGGYWTIGVGGRPGGGPLSLYGGLGAGGPYEGAGLVLQGGYRFPNGLTASMRTRLGYAGSQNSSGISAGVGYGRFRP